MKNLHSYIDHTLLRPDALEEEILALCMEGMQYNFASVCIHPQFVKMAAEILKESTTKVCTVIGFPLGANESEVKLFEAERALRHGADELDLVINLHYLKDEKKQEYIEEIRSIGDLDNYTLKVIIETSCLRHDEIRRASKWAIEGGADFVKTSTGFGSRGATLDDIRIIRDAIGPHGKIKASGGIKTYEQCLAFVEAGADRIGTSSGLSIVEEARSKGDR
jgi:deoxyribose-phosphate aldolase